MSYTRLAKTEDLPAITEIYNQAILNTTATFDTEPKTVEQQEPWFKKHDNNKYPLIVYDDGTIKGWASLSEWSDRCAYADTAELSIYVHEEYQGNRIGSELMDEIISLGKSGGVHTVLARITDKNEQSIKMHMKRGFNSIGIIKEVGRKFGKLIDVNLMQLIY